MVDDDINHSTVDKKTSSLAGFLSWLQGLLGIDEGKKPGRRIPDIDINPNPGFDWQPRQPRYEVPVYPLYPEEKPRWRDKWKDRINDFLGKPRVSDKDAGKLGGEIGKLAQGDEDLSLSLKQYENATKAMEKFKKKLYEDGKTVDGKVNVSELTEDQRKEYDRLQKKVDLATEMLTTDVQRLMPDRKEEYIDAAIRQIGKNIDKSGVAIEDDRIDFGNYKKQYRELPFLEVERIIQTKPIIKLLKTEEVSAVLDKEFKGANGVVPEGKQIVGAVAKLPASKDVEL